MMASIFFIAGGSLGRAQDTGHARQWEADSPAGRWYSEDRGIRRRAARIDGPAAQECAGSNPRRHAAARRQSAALPPPDIAPRPAPRAGWMAAGELVVMGKPGAGASGDVKWVAWAWRGGVGRPRARRADDLDRPVGGAVALAAGARYAARVSHQGSCRGADAWSGW